MSLPEFPPIIAGLPTCLQDNYARASSNPERRMRIICDHATRFPLTEDDRIALAIEEVRCAYQNQLPPGEYRNTQGQTFTVDEYGKRSTVSTRDPPAPHLIWVPRDWRFTPESVPSGYHFILGDWRLGDPTPPPTSPFPRLTGAVPAGMEGATFRGVLPSMPQHLQSSGWPPQINSPTVFDCRGYSFATAAPQQPLYVPAVPVQYEVCPPTAPEQQPAATTLPTQVDFDDHLDSSLLQFCAELDRYKTPEPVTKDVYIDCPYPGFAPGSGSEGPAE